MPAAYGPSRTTPRPPSGGMSRAVPRTGPVAGSSPATTRYRGEGRGRREVGAVNLRTVTGAAGERSVPPPGLSGEGRCCAALVTRRWGRVQPLVERRGGRAVLLSCARGSLAVASVDGDQQPNPVDDCRRGADACEEVRCGSTPGGPALEATRRLSSWAVRHATRALGACRPVLCERPHDGSAAALLDPDAGLLGDEFSSWWILRPSRNYSTATVSAPASAQSAREQVVGERRSRPRQCFGLRGGGEGRLKGKNALARTRPRA